MTHLLALHVAFTSHILPTAKVWAYSTSLVTNSFISTVFFSHELNLIPTYMVSIFLSRNFLTEWNNTNSIHLKLKLNIGSLIIIIWNSNFKHRRVYSRIGVGVDLRNDVKWVECGKTHSLPAKLIYFSLFGLKDQNWKSKEELRRSGVY